MPADVQRFCDFHLLLLKMEKPSLPQCQPPALTQSACRGMISFLLCLFSRYCDQDAMLGARQLFFAFCYCVMPMKVKPHHHAYKTNNHSNNRFDDHQLSPPNRCELSRMIVCRLFSESCIKSSSLRIAARAVGFGSKNSIGIATPDSSIENRSLIRRLCHDSWPINF